ncbi:MAG: LON peptidase substrate-binding domain-containing protein [Verrucomicrobia bacterium]|nr:LON peptidase substrate-binding domain-containing protein [Cytophagales bacterium]
MFLSLFPLGLVAFPKEKLNLHIFEPRYQQLINECLNSESNFGIPVYVGNRIAAYGTIMQISLLKELYEEGRMDIETEGLQVIKLLSFVNPAPDKLYAGGEVAVLLPDDSYDPLVKENLIEQVLELYRALQMELDVDLIGSRFLSYALGHKVGLNMEQQYEMLCMETEAERQEFLLEHLFKTVPAVEAMEKNRGELTQMQEKIRLNGHYRHFDPLSF